jgi:hypothetical protein
MTHNEAPTPPDISPLSDREWTLLVGERSYLDWWLRRTAKAVASRSAIDVAIDQATGAQATLTEEVRAAIARCDELDHLLAGYGSQSTAAPK